jgi:molybdopterin-containing oxidoreductase family membrane subunit
VLQAAVLVMMALLGIVTDMERPWRAAWMVMTPNPSSPFIYTGSAANLYMILAFVDLWILMTGKGGHKLATRMTLIALPAAIYLHTTTAFVLSLNKSRELWHTAVMVPIFLTSATASGIALLIIFAYVMQKLTDMEFKPSMFSSLTRLLSIVIIVDLFLLVVEILSVFWPTSAMPGHTIRLEEFITGRYAWAFLPVFILATITLVLIMRRRTGSQPKYQILAAALYVIAIFFKRYSLMAMGFSINTIGQPGPIYFPSAVETFLALGILAFGLLFVTVTVKVLPMQVPEDEHEEEVADEAAPSAAPATATGGDVAGEPALDSGVPSS